MEILKNNKMFIIIYLILIIISLGVVIFTYNNYSFYDDSIAKVIDINEEYVSSDTVTYGYIEDIYIQSIKARILNGDNKGKIITISNEYHKGQAYDQAYKLNDELFVSLNIRDNNIVDAHIEGYKRDKYIVLLIVMFVLVIVLIGRLKGFLSIISVILNIGLFYVIANLNAKGLSLVLLSFIGSILFSIICLVLVSGFNHKTIAAIGGAIGGLFVTMIISMLVIHFTNYNGIRFEQMDLLTRPYEGIFVSEIILGGLGAIMDISITMASSLNELIEKDNKIKIKSLYKSGVVIGKDVMSTMINVLFFTYICGILPNITIYFRNGIQLGYLVNEYISLEMSRALTGAIGIVVTIPISIFICLIIYKRRLNNE